MNSATLPHTESTSATPPRRTHHERLGKLGRLTRTRFVWLRRATLALVVLLLAAGLAAADFAWTLNWQTRAGGLVLLVVLSLGVRLFLKRRWNYDESRAAAQAETAWPDLGQRLRTSQDYTTRPEQASPADPRLVGLLEEDAELRMHDRAVEPLVPRRPIYLAIGTCSLVAVIWLLALVIAPQWRTSTGRLLLLPWHYSKVTLEPLPERVAYDQPLPVRIAVEGRPLKQAQMLYRAVDAEQGTQWTAVPLRPIRDPSHTATASRADNVDAGEGLATGSELSGLLAATVPPHPTDFEVMIKAGPLDDETHLVRVRSPLRLDEWMAEVEPPAYTGLPITKGKAESLRVPQGSRVILTARYSQTPETIEALLPAGIAPRYTIEQLDQRVEIRFEDLQETLDLVLRAESPETFPHETTPLQLEVIPDRAPSIRFLSPEPDSEVLATSELHFAVEAKDDYGISEGGIVYKIGSGPEQTLWHSDVDTASRDIRHTVILPLEELDLSFQDAITYYAFAVDKRGPDGERTVTPLQFIDVRPFRREYEFQQADSQGQCQGECLTLEKLIKSQRDLLRRTFLAQSQANVDASSNLQQKQSEILTQTDSLRLALQEKVGIIPPLDFAVADMEDAVAALGEQNLQRGVKLEEMALANLILARQNLRQILKQSNSQSAACKQVDQQQQQKFRPPEREPEQQEEQLNDLRRQMEQLAEKQRQWAKSAQACSQAASASGQSQKSEPKKAAGQSAASESQGPSSKDSQSEMESPASSGSEASQSESPQPEASKPENPQPEGSAANSPSTDPGGQQDAASARSSDKGSSSAGSESQPTSPTESQPSGGGSLRSDLVDKQAGYGEEARRLRNQLSADEYGALAGRRMQDAEQLIEASGQALESGEDLDAIRAARDAAETLDRLSRHLGRRESPDFQEKLKEAQSSAERLAAEQQQLASSLTPSSAQSGSKPEDSQEKTSASGSPATDKPDQDKPGQDKPGQEPSNQEPSEEGAGPQQSRLAEAAEELADILAKLEEEAVEQSWDVQRSFSEQKPAQAANDATVAMDQASRSLQQSQPSDASRQGQRAARQLATVASGLDQVQNALGRARLEQLLDAEERAAELTERLEKAQSKSDRTLAQARATELTDQLRPLARGDKPLETAVQQLKSALQAAQQTSSKSLDDTASVSPIAEQTPDETPEAGEREGGLVEARTGGVVDGLRTVDRILQKRIQEAILSGALQQSDEAVPLDYLDMVEDYYRRLSEDIE